MAGVAGLSHAMPHGPETLVDLPGELLARIFALLSPKELSELEGVCRRCRAVVVGHDLWMQHCLQAQPAIAAAVASIDASRVPHHPSRASGAAALPAAQAECSAGGAGCAPSGASSAAASQAASRALPAAKEPTAETPAGPAAGEAERRSAFFKRLHSSLAVSVAHQSLIADALAATSTDHPQEGVHHVLSPASRRSDLMCYWSSAGSEDQDSCEALACRLAHPLCVVSEVKLKPFRAFFQWGSPIYAPKAVRFRLGGLACFAADGTPLPHAALAAAASHDMHARPPGPAPVADAGAADAQAGSTTQQPPQQAQHAQQQQGLPQQQREQQQGEQQWVWESPEYPVESADALQSFPIPPTLCVGGYLRVDLLGKPQRQAADDRYYSCVCYLKAVGHPVHSYQLEQQQQQFPSPPPQQQDGEPPREQQWGAAAGGWRLAYLSPDPLQAVGGLAAVSEGGRLAAAQHEEDSEGEDDDSDWDTSEDEGEMPVVPEGVAFPGAGGGLPLAHGADTSDEEWQPGGDAGAY